MFRRHHLSRVIRYASWVRIVGTEQFSTLCEPALIAMNPLTFTVVGFERIDGLSTVQSWLVPAGD